MSEYNRDIIQNTRPVQNRTERFSSNAAVESGSAPLAAFCPMVSAKLRCSRIRATSCACAVVVVDDAAESSLVSLSGSCCGSRLTVTTPWRVKSWPGGQSS